MKYKVIPTSYKSWIVEKEDGDVYYVSIKGVPLVYLKRDTEFVCSCKYYTLTKKPCKHIKMVIKYLRNNIKEFNEER